TYGIGIEICVNHEKNGETKCSKYFRESLENAAVLCAELMHKYNLSIRAVTQHYDYSGKNCPQTIRECGLWDEFKQMIQNRYDELKQLRSGK
ncbi:MAG: N-acetylmuramoyl-L-alanine amidase, partial [Clostridia bacterium]|nr:N-acetylmuramoyl-L-alanine amidase [Clostridia bacterium]